MIFVTGDCHKDFERFEKDKFTIQEELTKDDYVIICGDFGGVWSFEKESESEKAILDKLNEKNFTTLFVDGNHENFDRLNKYEEIMWHGGRVNKIRDSILHLRRGEIFDIDGYKIFAFGGAASHDIKDGIFNLDEEEKIYEMRKRGGYFRIKGYSWWDEEMPSEDEMKYGIDNLEKNDYKVDYIISHCAPTSVQTLMNSTYKMDELTEYFQAIYEKCNYTKWFFGHYHKYRQVNPENICLYEEIIPIDYKSIFDN